MHMAAGGGACRRGRRVSAGAARVGGGGACRPGLQGRWLGAYLSGQIRDQLL
jgi:hypothetical protein